jgi:coenzyme F420-reducing hydrogenase delta subunit/heterodisulfide reductase subunit C
MSQSTAKSNSFAAQVRAIPGGEYLEACFSCGTCVSKCMIQQKIEPRYNPRKLLRLVMLDEREAAFSSPTTWLCSACDLCYPACPQEIHISDVIAAVKELAVKAGYKSPLHTVSVDEALCAGCGICGMACPYEAPSLVEKSVNGKLDRVATVDINKCMGCGTCVAACPTGAISRPGVSNQEIKEQLYSAITTNGKPRLLIFVCDWCLRANADVQLLESYPENIHIIHIPCSGRIDPEMALLALRSGIDGVLVCGCLPGECHYKRGTLLSACKIGLLDEMLNQMGIESIAGSRTNASRIRFVQIGTRDRGRIRTEIDNMLEHLNSLKEVA